MNLSLNPQSDRPVVLVVDDAPSSLGVLCDTLEGAGYTVLVACDGESALERLELVSPDAILMDALMPGMDGFETCRRIKSDPAWAHVPVIFMTGLSETSQIVKGFDAGGVDYVVKPVSFRKLRRKIENALGMSKSPEKTPCEVPA
jgi:CheY-like chemotaxis protein